MLKDFVLEGGPLMLILAAMFFVVLVLVLYAGLLHAVEVRRARRFRSAVSALKSPEAQRLPARLLEDDSLPARFLSRLARQRPNAAGPSDRPRGAQIEEALLAELTWPGEVLHFLGAYATKVGLCGTILGLCFHFLAFGTAGSAQVASRAMAVALYTTLGALAIALVAEPAAYALSWGERWFRRDLQFWEGFMDDSLRAKPRARVNARPATATDGTRVATTAPPAAARKTRETDEVAGPCRGRAVGPFGDTA